jgi:hypothetical protein
MLITFSSARVHGRRTKLEYGAFDLRRVFHRPKRGNRFVRAAGLLPPFLSAQFRCLPEIFRVLDKCISIGHARDVIGNLTYAL